MPELLLSWIGSRQTWNLDLVPPPQLQLHPPQLQLHLVDVAPHNGRVMIIVMMKTTMPNVTMMEEIVVITINQDGIITAKHVNASKAKLQLQRQLQLHLAVDVVFQIGLKINIVMMKTTMLSVTLMEELVATQLMDG